MSQVKPEIPPAKWQACVNTVKCDFIDEYVSIMVKNDWTSRCTWYARYKDSASGSEKRVKPDRMTKKKLQLCQGPLCSYVEGYREKLIKEEGAART